MGSARKKGASAGRQARLRHKRLGIYPIALPTKTSKAELATVWHNAYKQAYCPTPKSHPRVTISVTADRETVEAIAAAKISRYDVFAAGAKLLLQLEQSD